jgi:hypothetical protein
MAAIAPAYLLKRFGELIVLSAFSEGFLIILPSGR